MPTIFVLNKDWFHLPPLGMSRNILLDSEFLEVRDLGVLFLGVFLEPGAVIGS